MATFEEALAAYRQLVIDMDGDGIPDAPLQQPAQVGSFRQRLEHDPRGEISQPQQPTNAMLQAAQVAAGPLVPLLLAKGVRDAAVPLADAERAGSMAVAPFHAVNRMLTPGYDYSNTEQAARDAFDASGLAITGGLGAAAMGAVPEGAVGMAGSGWRGLFGKRPPTPEPDIVERMSGHSSARGTPGQVENELRATGQAEQTRAQDIANIERKQAELAEFRNQQRAAYDEFVARRNAAAANEQAQAASNRMLQGMRLAGQQGPFTPSPPESYSHRMLQRMSQAGQTRETPIASPRSSEPPSPLPPRELRPVQFDSQRPPTPTAQTIPPASGVPTPGGERVGGTLANPLHSQPGSNHGTSSAQTSRPPQVRYTQQHTEIMQSQFEHMMRGAGGNINSYGDLDSAAKSELVKKLREEFRARGLAAPSAENLSKRLDGTMQALADLQSAGANIRDPKVLRLAFGRPGTLGIAGGVPMGLSDRNDYAFDEPAMGKSTGM